MKVAIIGGGISGLSCAIRLVELVPAASITLLEKGKIGGSSAIAIGSFAAARTPRQIRAGYVDSPEQHLAEVGDAMRGTETDRNRTDPLLRMVCLNAPEALGWLESKGVTFAGPFWEAPHTKPRMFNLYPDSRTNLDRLAAVARGLPQIAVLENTRVQKVLPGSPPTVITSGATAYDHVVLAVGDHSASYDDFPAVNEGADGRLLKQLADDTGAPLDRSIKRPQLRAWNPALPRIAPVPTIVRQGSLLRDNQRYPGAAVLDEPVKYVGGPFDLEIDYETYRYTPITTFPGTGWASLDDLFAAGLARRGEVGKAIVGPLKLALTTADGGLRVNESLHVLDASADRLPGLYACGAAALGGLRMGGHGHHLSWAIVSALRAAKQIADMRA